MRRIGPPRLGAGFKPSAGEMRGPRATVLVGVCLWAAVSVAGHAGGQTVILRPPPAESPGPLVAGDRVVGWRSSSRSGLESTGTVSHPLDLAVPQLLAEGTLSLQLERGGEIFEVPWHGAIGPHIGPRLTASAAEALSAAADSLEILPAVWIRQREQWRRQPARQADALWLTWCLAVRARDGEAFAQAVAEWRQAVPLAAAARPRLVTVAMQELAWDLENLGDLGAAEQAYAQAVEQARSDHPASLLLGLGLHRQASLLLRFGRSKEAVPLLEEARSLRTRLAPGSASLAATLNNLGLALPDVGRVEEGEAALRSALAIRLRIEPESSRVAGVYNNLGILAYQRGDLASAEDYYRRAKDLRQRLIPGSLHFARSLNNLAAVIESRGDADKAELWYQQALELRRRLAPDGLEVSSSLSNLATLRLHRGDVEGAIDYAGQALRHIRRVAAGSEIEAWSAKVLAHVLLETGRAEEAVAPAQKSVELYRSLVHETVESADAEAILGQALLRAGRYDVARPALERSLQQRRRNAPGSRWEADSWRLLGELERRASGPGKALEYYRRAFEIVENIEGSPGQTPRERAEAASEFVDWYRHGVEILASLGRIEAAFELLERARARGLLAVTAERQLRLDDELPPTLLAARRGLAADYESARQELAATDPRDSVSRGSALQRLNQLRDDREALLRELRRFSPRLAAMAAPVSFDWARIGSALAVDSALLSYSVGEAETWLFVGVRDASPGDPRLSLLRLPIGRQELHRRVTSLCLLLRLPTTSVAEIRRRSRQLYELLLAPAAPLLEGRRHLQIVADQGLYRLPFAALVDPAGRWLIEEQALTLVPSATLAMNRKPLAETPTLLAFADPSPAQPLPWSRLEVREIERVVDNAGAETRTFTGPGASESRLKSDAAWAGRLHLATHAVVDDLFPLDSHLLLRPSAGDDGKLRVWEIFEELRLEANLVTLSGCETGLGRELDGEGLIGLVRAFLFAGARSVVASKWRVEDRGTSAFMGRFYAGLAGGDKAEALRRAQAVLAGAPVALPPTGGLLEALGRRLGLGSPVIADLRHPYYWAGFELTGDRR